MDQEAAELVALYGAPIFTYASTFKAPVGSEGTYRKVRKETDDPTTIRAKLAEEYYIILHALLEMGFDIRIALAYPQGYPQDLINGAVDLLGSEGLEFFPLRYPDIDLQSILYPRDLAVFLSNNTVLVDSDLINLDIDLPLATGRRVIKSVYGQGGRVMLRHNTILVPENVGGDEGVYGPTNRSRVQFLKNLGLEVGVLPNPIDHTVNDQIDGYEPQDHLDRFGGLLEDGEGNLHFILIPNVQTGLSSIFSPPECSPKETLKQFCQICDQLQIKLHVPRRLFLPGSIGFEQFKSGDVLMTSGEPHLAELVASIVGEEQVHETLIPIKYYPVWCKASIRCLINTFPTWFLELIKDRYQPTPGK